MAILIQTSTAEEDKNRWATQWTCFRDAERLYGRPFEIDVCAEPETAKVNRFFASADWLESRRLSAFGMTGGDGFRLREGQVIEGFDALLRKWPANWWCNPPFDRKVEFLRHARRQALAGRPGMMLIPYEPLALWFRDNVGLGTVIYEPDGRYNFYEIDGETKKQGSNFGSVLVHFPPFMLLPSLRQPFKRGRK